MRGNPTVGEMLERMRRRKRWRKRFRSGLKSLDPTFKTFTVSGPLGGDCADPEPWITDGYTAEVFLVEDDEVPEAYLLHDDEPASPLWKQAIGWVRGHANRAAESLTKRIQEDRELAEMIVGLLVLATGTAVGLLWHSYRVPIVGACTRLIDFVLWIAAILRQ